MCIPYKKGIMQESHTYYLLSKYMDHTISTEELKTLRLLVNLSDDDELSLSLSLLWENGRPFEEVDERLHKMRESYEICSAGFKIEREKNDSLWCLGNWLVSPQYY